LTSASMASSNSSRPILCCHDATSAFGDFMKSASYHRAVA